MATSDLRYPQVASSDEWLQARVNLLNQEKELTQARDRLNTARRELPMVHIKEKYTFEIPDGPKPLLDLFAGRLQLIVYRWVSRARDLQLSHACGARSSRQLRLSGRETTF